MCTICMCIYMDKNSRTSMEASSLTVMNDSPKAYHLISIRKIKKKSTIAANFKNNCIVNKNYDSF